MRLKEFEIFEAATSVATCSGNIAAVVNPHVAHNNKKPNRKWKPTDNALDMDVTLLASKEPSMIRRQIQEGSLYEGLPFIAGLAAALAGAGYAGYKKLKGKDDEETPAAAKTKNIFQQRHEKIKKAVEKAESGN